MLYPTLRRSFQQSLTPLKEIFPINTVTEEGLRSICARRHVSECVYCQGVPTLINLLVYMGIFRLRIELPLPYVLGVPVWLATSAQSSECRLLVGGSTATGVVSVVALLTAVTSLVSAALARTGARAVAHYVENDTQSKTRVYFTLFYL